MIRSMTGFGSARTQFNGWTLRAEMRSVNHRDVQFSFRLPEMLQLQEYELQKILEKEIRRGHVYFALTCRSVGAAQAVVDREAARQYLDALRELAEESNVPCQVDLAGLLRLPGTLAEPMSDDERRSTLWPHVIKTTEACLSAMVEMRCAEGAALSEHLTQLCDTIEELTGAVKDAQTSFAPAYRDRLRDRVARLLDGTDIVVNEDTLAREVAMFADRSDVSEEIARMGSHVSQFRQALAVGGKPVGRRMEFLGQEMLREAGTMAAKVPAGQHVVQVLELRTAVDRLREQVRNVE